MRQKVDVLQMIVRLVLSVHLLLGFSRMYALENAEPPAGTSQSLHQNGHPAVLCLNKISQRPSGQGQVMPECIAEEGLEQGSQAARVIRALGDHLQCQLKCNCVADKAQTRT